MSKLRDIYRVLAGDLSTEAITRLIQTNNEQRRGICEWKGRATTAQALGEAIATGNSRKVGEIAQEALGVESSRRYCAFCDRESLHFANGHCLQCGVKCE